MAEEKKIDINEWSQMLAAAIWAGSERDDEREEALELVAEVLKFDPDTLIMKSERQIKKLKKANDAPELPKVGEASKTDINWWGQTLAAAIWAGSEREEERDEALEHIAEILEFDPDTLIMKVERQTKKLRKAKGESAPAPQSAPTAAAPAEEEVTASKVLSATLQGARTGGLAGAIIGGVFDSGLAGAAADAAADAIKSKLAESDDKSQSGKA